MLEAPCRAPPIYSRHKSVIQGWEIADEHRSCVGGRGLVRRRMVWYCPFDPLLRRRLCWFFLDPYNSPSRTGSLHLVT